MSSWQGLFTYDKIGRLACGAPCVFSKDGVTLFSVSEEVTVEAVLCTSVDIYMLLCSEAVLAALELFALVTQHKGSGFRRRYAE